MTTKIRPILATLAAAGCTMIPVASFAAGAQVYQDNWSSGQQCYDSSLTGAHICVAQKGKWTYVTTPSGNINYMFNGTSVQSITLGGATTQTSVESHEKSLFKNGDYQVDHSFTQLDIVETYNGQCQSINVEYDLNYVNGTVVENNFLWSETTCK